jgi:uncharacterized protein YbjT (DUF2867 family)
MSRRIVVVMGATGLVGGHLVQVLAADETVEKVVAPVRRAVTDWVHQRRIEAPVVDLDALSQSSSRFQADQVFICLGTTMKVAGSKEAFRRVDFDYVVESARLAVEGGARDAYLVSSVGADPESKVFYSRIKGEAEAALSALPFRSVHIFRPSVLVGERKETRPGERFGIAVGKLLTPVLVGPARRYRPIEALTVARAMAAAARQPEPGVHVLESEEIAALAAEAAP